MTYLRSTDFASASTTRFNLLGKLPAGAAALMLGVSGAAMMSGSARADCDPLADGTNQVITCDAVDDNVGDQTSYSALNGDDTINIIDGVYTGTISGNNGNDTITLNGAGANVNDLHGSFGDDTILLLSGTVGHVDGDEFEDTITLNGAVVDSAQGLDGGGGDDTIFLLSGSVAFDVDGEIRDDTITLDGASITGDIIGGAGNDTINVLSGNVDNVFADSGNDTINLDGGTVTSNIDGGDGNDTIDLASGTALNVIGDTGDDTITLSGAMVDFITGREGNDTVDLISGTVTDVSGGDDNDTITLDGAVVTTAIGGAAGDDTIDLLSGSVINVLGNSGNDTITLNGATVSNSIFGDTGPIETGDDTILLQSGTVTMNVEGDAGHDTISLTGAAVNNSILGDDGNDTIELVSGTVFIDVLGGEGDDSITLSGAAVGDDINGDSGDDLITMLGGSVDDDVNGGAGNDVIDLQSGTVGDRVVGDIGDDTITLNGADVNDDILAGGGEDTINILGGMVTDNVEGGTGNDTIALNGGDIGGDILGDEANDDIDLNGGTVNNVFGGAGEDMITLNGAGVSSNLNGDDGNDTIELLSGSVGANARGNAGDDTITLAGATVSNNVNGGTGNDIIDLLSGSATNVAGDDGNDMITLNGASIGNNIQGENGDDVTRLITGSFGNDLLAGDGSDIAVISASYDLTTIVGDLDGGDDALNGDGFIDTLFILSSGTLTGEQLINWETIQVGLGTSLTLEGAGLTTESAGPGNFGLQVVQSSTLNLDDGFAVIGDIGVDDGSTIVASTPGGTGVYSASDDLLNFATIDMSDGLGAGDTFFVGQDYYSNSELLLDVALNATEAGDSLVIGDDIIAISPTEITFTDTDPFGPGSFTGTGPGNGIIVVDNSAGGHIVDGDFIFDPIAHPTNEILKVPFVYTLNLESDDILYLQSDVLAQIYGYAILAELMREDFPGLRERLGDRRYNGFSGDGTDNDGAAGGGVGWDNGGIWAQIRGARHSNEHEGDFTTGEWESSRVEAEVGVDIPMDVGGGLGVFGISAHFIHGNADANSGLTPDPDVAEVQTTGFGGGLSFAYFPGGGFYADVQGRFTAWDGDVEVVNRNIDQDINAIGWGASLEVGNRIGFGNTAVTPRGRAVYTDVDIESFTDDDGVEVSQDDSASVVVEAGVTVEQMFPDNGVSIFADASVSHDVLSDSGIDASGFSFESGMEDTWGTVSIGGSMETGQGTSAYIAADVSSPFGSQFGDSIGYGLRAGVRVDF